MQRFWKYCVGTVLSLVIITFYVIKIYGYPYESETDPFLYIFYKSLTQKINTQTAGRVDIQIEGNRTDEDIVCYLYRREGTEYIRYPDDATIFTADNNILYISNLKPGNYRIVSGEENEGLSQSLDINIDEVNWKRDTVISKYETVDPMVYMVEDFIGEPQTQTECCLINESMLDIDIFNNFGEQIGLYHFFDDAKHGLEEYLNSPEYILKPQLITIKVKVTYDLYKKLNWKMKLPDLSTPSEATMSEAEADKSTISDGLIKDDISESKQALTSDKHSAFVVADNHDDPIKSETFYFNNPDTEQKNDMSNKEVQMPGLSDTGNSHIDTNKKIVYGLPNGYIYITYADRTKGVIQTSSKGIPKTGDIFPDKWGLFVLLIAGVLYSLNLILADVKNDKEQTDESNNA